jgi:hypothetical protein
MAERMMGVKDRARALLRAPFRWLSKVTIVKYVLYVVGMLRPFLKWSLSFAFSRHPAPPSLRLIDARSDRIKTKLLSHMTSRFNIDEFQLRFAPEAHDSSAEHTTPWTEHNYRTLVCLLPNTRYTVYARTRNRRGCSRWGPAIHVQTLLAPVDGGAKHEEYEWGQNAHEIWLKAAVPNDMMSRHVTAVLRSDFLDLSYRLQGVTTSLAQGMLRNRVRLLSPDGGSYWEISRDNGCSTLTIVMEKESAATSVKWGFWRSLFVGQAEIDTHAIAEDSIPPTLLQQPDGTQSKILDALMNKHQNLRGGG